MLSIEAEHAETGIVHVLLWRQQANSKLVQARTFCWFYPTDKNLHLLQSFMGVTVFIILNISCIQSRLPFLVTHTFTCWHREVYPTLETAQAPVAPVSSPRRAAFLAPGSVFPGPVFPVSPVSLHSPPPAEPGQAATPPGPAYSECTGFVSCQKRSTGRAAGLASALKSSSLPMHTTSGASPGLPKVRHLKPSEPDPRLSIAPQHYSSFLRRAL